MARHASRLGARMVAVSANSLMCARSRLAKAAGIIEGISASIPRILGIKKGAGVAEQSVFCPHILHIGAPKALLISAQKITLAIWKQS